MPMDNLAVNAEAITALKNMRAELDEQIIALKNETTKLKDAFEVNQHGLGPRAEKLRTLLDQLGAQTEDAGQPVKHLVLKLDTAAMLRQMQLDDGF